MYRKFASIEFSNKYGYAFDSSVFDSKAQVSDHWRMFETGGDGLTQHSPDWGITREHMADYMASLAVAMKGRLISTTNFNLLERACDDDDENVQFLPDGELISYVRHDFECKPTIADIEFAASVRYVEGKYRWYSIKEGRISSSESKRHDKRYEEVRPEHDGSAKSIYGLLVGIFPNALRAYNYAAAIYDWTRAGDSSKKPWMLSPAKFLDWTKDSYESDRLEAAHYACQSLCEGYRLLNVGAGCIRNYRRQLEHHAAKSEAA